MFHRSRELLVDDAVTPRSLPFLARNARLNIHPVDEPLGPVIQAPAEDRAVRHVVADLAADWSAVAADSIDHAIVEGLRRLATTMDADHALVWWHTPETAKLSSLGWKRNAVAHTADLLDAASTEFAKAALTAGRPACFAMLDDLSPRDRAALARLGLWSLAIVPLSIGPDMPGALAVGSSDQELVWTPGLLHELRIVAALAANLVARQAAAAAIESAQVEIRQLQDRLCEERAPSRPATRTVRLSRPIVSDGPAIKRALAQVEQVAPTPATVLLLGETGVGKEVFAQAIHDMSPRGQRPMIRVSCAAIPAALIESELFGRERGAYTGALTRQIGRFEAAHGSTIFLDEIGDLSGEIQIKLLRVLQERVVERLGSTQSVKVDVRVIAATNRNLEKAVQDKTFREDLYYRLNVFPIEIPPLRERPEDIPALVWEFVDEFSKSFGKTIESIDKVSMEQIARYSWPGNVRELRNLIERATIVATGPRLTVPVPQPLTAATRPPSSMTLHEVEVEHIRAALDATNWRVRGRRGAAERLGLKPTTLEGRMAKLGLARPKQ